MKSIWAILITIFSFSAYAQISIENFELLKVLDGKHQTCKSRVDYYKPGSYTFFTRYQRQPVNSGEVEMFSVFMGQYCHEYKVGSSYQYIWLSRDLGRDYDYPVLRDTREEYVTVVTKDHTVIITDRSSKVIKEYAVKIDPAGAISLGLKLPLIKGVLSNDLQVLNNGQSVRSVFFVYLRQHETHRYSWNSEETRSLMTGPGYSLVFTIKNNAQ